jgi:riboflavin synthase
MFTGLIETVGRVVDARTVATGLRLRIQTELASELSPGESLAVNGVCLTVVLSQDGDVHADVGPETIRVTTLGSLKRDQPVNLERPLRADSRFGGHFVQGHVDGTGTVMDIRPDGEAHWLAIAFNPELSPFLIRKGSISVDGISLTVAGLGEAVFDVMVIPFTWSHTSLSSLHVTDRVNLECDMVGKYIARAAELWEPGRFRPAPASS